MTHKHFTLIGAFHNFKDGTWGTVNAHVMRGEHINMATVFKNEDIAHAYLAGGVVIMCSMEPGTEAGDSNILELQRWRDNGP